MDDNEKKLENSRLFIELLLNRFFSSRKAKVSYFDLLLVAWLYGHRNDLCEYFQFLIGWIE